MHPFCMILGSSAGFQRPIFMDSASFARALKTSKQNKRSLVILFERKGILKCWFVCSYQLAGLIYPYHTNVTTLYASTTKVHSTMSRCATHRIECVPGLFLGSGGGKRCATLAMYMPQLQQGLCKLYCLRTNRSTYTFPKSTKGFIHIRSILEAQSCIAKVFCWITLWGQWIWQSTLEGSVRSEHERWPSVYLYKTSKRPLW